jgi:hypothetical protein
MRRLSLILAVLMVGLAAVAMAAEEPEAERVVIEGVKVHPGQYLAYQEAVKGFLPILAEHDYPQYFYAFEGEDMTFYFSSPVEDLAEVSRNWDAWPDFMEKVGADKLEPHFEAFTGTFEYAQHALWRHRPDLSYRPDEPRWDPMENRFRFWGVIYVRGGMEKQFETTFKKFVDLFTEKEVDWSWATYVGEFGTEMPVYVYSEVGPGPGEFWTEAKKVGKPLEEESKAIWMEMLDTVRDVEFIRTTFRPDMSWMPKAEEEPASE